MDFLATPRYEVITRWVTSCEINERAMTGELITETMTPPQLVIYLASPGTVNYTCHNTCHHVNLTCHTGVI